MDWTFGLGAIVVGLAIISAIPLLNFLSLGYMLECSGRIARTGRLRDGFVGIRKASILGGLAIFTWLALLPVRFVSSLWRDAELIDPESGPTTFMLVALVIFSVLAFGHITWACVRGGRARHFLWPAPIRFFRWIKSEPNKFGTIRDAVLDYLSGLRLRHYTWLGVRGFAGGLVWLFLPVMILILAGQLPKVPGTLLSLVGVLGLAIAVVYLPFLQAHFARTGRFRSLFEWREVRRYFRNAPIAFWLALFVTVLLAMPLYLLKAEMTPQELAWLPGLFFVASILPARFLAGWAMGRAVKAGKPAIGAFQWISRIAFVPVALAYALWVFLMQYISWSGSLSLLEQHAFLLPAPLLSL
tara:strand:- start:971 stop:2038 length:1068 start_codon:yes stop_codon:yes gene_type:complete